MAHPSVVHVMLVLEVNSKSGPLQIKGSGTQIRRNAKAGPPARGAGGFCLPEIFHFASLRTHLGGVSVGLGKSESSSWKGENCRR